MNIDEDEMEISGYAWSGGGRSIVRVECTMDNGETWTTAVLGEGKDQRVGRAWGWTLWKATIQIPKGKYSKRRRSNVAVIIDRIVFISSFLF